MLRECGCPIWMNDAHAPWCALHLVMRTLVEAMLRYSLIPDFAYLPHCKAYYKALDYEISRRRYGGVARLEGRKSGR